MSHTQTLTLRSIGPNPSQVDGCLDYSTYAKIQVPVKFTSFVASPHTSAIQKEVFQLVIPIGYAEPNHPQPTKTYTITREYQHGWTVSPQN